MQEKNVIIIKDVKYHTLSKLNDLIANKKIISMTLKIFFGIFKKLINFSCIFY